jgi:hypothetical protein
MKWTATRHLQWVIRPTWRTATNFAFHSEFAVHNILQNYIGTGEDDKKPGLILGDNNDLSVLSASV